jgi:hypothetical protein
MAGGTLAIERGNLGRLCVGLAHIAPDGRVADGDESRYLRVVIGDGVATPLVAHLYDLGPKRGFYLAGIER